MAIQFTCPYCKKEFPYDNGAIDAEISKLSQMITHANKRIVELKAVPYLPDGKKERRKIGIELEAMKARISELKSVRKAANEHKNRTEYGIFKELVRDKLGEDEFIRLIEQKDEMMKAYSVSSMMKHEYTRSNSLSNVTSINKL